MRKIVLEACLRNSDNDEYFNVGFPGRHGAEGILVHDAATNFMQGVKDVIYRLDGDIRKNGSPRIRVMILKLSLILN